MSNLPTAHYECLGRLVVNWAEAESKIKLGAYFFATALGKLDEDNFPRTAFAKKLCPFWKSCIDELLANDAPLLARGHELIKRAATLKDQRDRASHWVQVSLDDDNLAHRLNIKSFFLPPHIERDTITPEAMADLAAQVAALTQDVNLYVLEVFEAMLRASHKTLS